MNDLPDPACTLGYTNAQVTEILGNREQEFNRWMYGQTMGLCDGRIWNPDRQAYDASGCGPHGVVVYRGDLQRFLLGLPVVD